MNQYRILAGLVAMTLALPSYAVDGPTAPYNETVTTVNGKRVVEVMPFPKQMQFLVPVMKKPSDPQSHALWVEEVETPAGLMDCAMTPYFHPNACEPTNFGKSKRPREWAVKLHGTWQLCIGREAPTACIPLIFDGKLRALPTAPLE